MNIPKRSALQSGVKGQTKQGNPRATPWADFEEIAPDFDKTSFEVWPEADLGHAPDSAEAAYLVQEEPESVGVYYGIAL